MTEIVFHLGDRKTGSTAIQTTLAAGAWSCETRRLLYPGKALNHVPLARAISGEHRGAKPGRTMAEHFDMLRRQIDRARPDVALISAEHFESVAPEALDAAIRQHLPGHPVRLIAYVRPHAERVASEFAEQVKQGHFFGTIDELHRRTLEHGRFLYSLRFGRWRAVFGDRFTLRPMIRSRLLREDVVADLLDFALAGAPFTLTGALQVNESLGLEDLAVLRAVQRRLGTGRGKASELQSATGWALARRLMAMPPQGTRVRLHRALAEEVVEAYRADAAALDAEFFEGAPMTEALEAAPGRAVAEAQSVRVRDHYTPREQRLIDFFSDQLAELLSAESVEWPEFFRRRHRAQVKGQAEAAPAPAPTVAAAAPGRGRRRGKGAGAKAVAADAAADGTLPKARKQPAAALSDGPGARPRKGPGGGKAAPGRRSPGRRSRP